MFELGEGEQQQVRLAMTHQHQHLSRLRCGARRSTALCLWLSACHSFVQTCQCGKVSDLNKVSGEETDRSEAKARVCLSLCLPPCRCLCLAVCLCLCVVRTCQCGKEWGEDQAW